MNLVIIFTKQNENTIGYLKYGNTNLWADIGTYEYVFDSIKRKHLEFLSKYSFYGTIK
jgi:hypothetical protein